MTEFSLHETVKNELITAGVKQNAENAFMSGLLRGAGKLSITSKGVGLIINLNDGRLGELCGEILRKKFNADPTVIMTEKNIGIRMVEAVKIILNCEESASVLYKCGIIGKDFTIIENLPDKLIKKASDKAAYIKGVFLGCGILSAPSEGGSARNSGYHMEFKLNSPGIASGFSALLDGIRDTSEGKVLVRKDEKSVYIKSAELISDCLAVMGANNGVMTVYRILASRDMRNLMNRRTNLDIANINKAVDAAGEQLMKIIGLFESGEYDSIDGRLRELAVLRIENPEATLSQLALMTNPPSTKSAVNHRMRKLLSLCESDFIKKNIGG